MYRSISGKIKNALLGLLEKLQKKKKLMSIEEQLNYIDKFPYPSDDFERVYFQYLANSVDVSHSSIILLNIIGNCLLPFFILYFLLNRLFFQRKTEEKKAALVIWYPNKEGKDYDYSDIIPYINLTQEFGDIYSLKLTSWFERLKGVWGKEPFSIWKTLFLRYPSCGYMNLTCMIQLMYINKIIMIHNPKIILEARREDAYASTLITNYCERIGKEYGVFMHGFISTNKRFSFVRFSRIYIWNQYFIKHFVRVYAKTCRYYVYFPGIFSSQIIEKSSEVPADYIYYLSGCESSATMYEVNDDFFTHLYKEMMILVKAGNTVRIRPHPRWSDVNLIISFFSGSGIEIEDTNLITINASISNCKCAIGIYSTVLLQAYFQGIQIAIDDVTDPAVFREINERNAFLLHLPHRLLSEIISKSI